MPENQTIATRDSWKVLAPSGPFIPIPYTDRFSALQFEVICHGLIPSEMEDKWFIYFERPWLYLHRSWTGKLVYRVKFEPCSRGSAASVAEVLDDAEQHKRSSPSYEAQLLDFLVRGLLLGEQVAFPVPETDSGPSGVYQHHVVGLGAPEVRVSSDGRSSWLRRLIRRLRGQSR